MDNEHRVYVARSPGLRCQCCGKDISNRAITTQYCTDCANRLAKERDRAKKIYFEKLKARDAPLPRIPWKSGDPELKCQICGYIDHEPDDIFCYHCGQRLKEDTNG